MTFTSIIRIKELLPTENLFLKIIFILGWIHLVAILLNSGLPFALLYGPLLFQSHLSLVHPKLNRRTLFFLFLPFLCLSVWHLVLKSNAVSIEVMNEVYYSAYLYLTAVSLFLSGVLVLLQRGRWKLPISNLKSTIILQLSTICIIVPFFIALLVIERLYQISFDVQLQYIVFMLLLLASILLSRYLYQEFLWKRQVENEESKAVRSNGMGYPNSLPEELLKDYAERVHKCLMADELYLRPGLSVTLLAQETNIPKHHFSALFNGYLGKNFYALIAEYRIKKAILLMQDDSYSFTIEALAYECGFNSKTSFNKYFKELTGCSPSEFRNHRTVV